MWEQIRYNQTRTAMLLAGMAAVLLLACCALSIFYGGIYRFGTFECIVTGVIIASSIWIVASLIAYSRGDDTLLRLVGARKISSSDHPRLYNIVEELKIGSGLDTMPSLYIVDDPAMNAFAIGCRPEKAAIIVTSGLLNKLSRDELQGVIGHEMAHINNRDVLLMTLCITLLSSITLIGRAMTRGAIPKEKYAPQKWGWRIMLVSLFIAIVATIILISGQPFMATFIYVIALALSMPTVAHLIYYATSRRREYLADASSALYTRYPEGLATALEKIAASTNQVLSANPATAPIYIVNPFREPGRAASDITSTHPPISERIHILRSMSHISFADYDRAYREVRGLDKGIIPTTAMAATGIIPMRAAMPDDLNDIQRARETSNVLWNINNYKLINCTCGTRMRLPPSFKLHEVRCPHCGKVNPV
jgi:heat shock protein HtpX